MTSSVDVNPYAPPVDVTPVFRRDKHETLSTSQIVAWLIATVVAQVVMTVVTVRFIRQPIQGLPFESPHIHLAVSVGIALWAAVHLTKRYEFVPAISLAEALNGVLWIVFPLTVQFLVLVEFSDVSLTPFDLWIFLGIWVASSLAILVVSWIVHRRPKQA